jgi:hypothetical protein
MIIDMINPFPCFIGETILDIDDETHRGLFELIDQIREKMTTDLISYSSYFHIPSVHNANKHYSLLSEKITCAANTYYRTLKNIEEPIDALRMQRMWINVFKQHGYTTFHDHWELPYSYTFYLDDSTTPLRFMHPSQIKSTNYHFVKPKQHKLVIWPGWLMHEIMPNRNIEDRISIAGKLNWTQSWLTPDGRPHDNDPLDKPKDLL